MSALPPPDPRRALPLNAEAERVVVGTALWSRDWSVQLAFYGFRPDWLHLPAHRTLWALTEETREQIPSANAVDMIEIQSRLVRDGALESIGGPGALLEILNSAITASAEQAAHFAGILRTQWQRRQAIEHGIKLVSGAYDPLTDFDHSLDTATRALGSLSAPVAASLLLNGKEVLAEVIDDLIRAHAAGEPLESSAIPTGLAELDEKTGGLIPYFWLIGADTSGGKTVLAMQLVRAALRAGKRALVFPLEMQAKQLVRRTLAAESLVPMSRLVSAWKLTHEDTIRICGIGSEWNSKLLTIYNDQDVTIQEVRAIARAEHAREPLGVVLLDYCQLATAGRFREGANREQEISFIGAQLSKMASELGIPVIAPTQLNDEGKVRESRALKHHAAVYLVIDEGDEETKPPRQPRILCVKNRDGERDWAMPYALAGDVQTFERQ